MVLDASTDLSSLRVVQLKALAASKGVPCSGCAEKADYIAALRGWLDTQQQQQQPGSAGVTEEREL